MLHLRGVKLQLGLKPLRRNLTRSVYSENIFVIPILINDFVGITIPFIPCSEN